MRFIIYKSTKMPEFQDIFGSVVIERCTIFWSYFLLKSKIIAKNHIHSISDKVKYSLKDRIFCLAELFQDCYINLSSFLSAFFNVSIVTG